MSKKSVTGTCHICGNSGKLTKEHIPPKSAFNDKTVIRAKFEDILTLGPDEKPKGPQQQGGFGLHTLCASCNNKTGSWYGKHFVDWCYQGMDILIRSEGNPSLIYMNYMFPLPIIKQIISMMFSVNNPIFRNKHDYLVNFILNKTKKYLPPEYRFFAFFTLSNNFRFSGVASKVNVYKSESSTFCEITYPPFGYVMTFDSDPPDNRLYEITHFANFDYNEFSVQYLRLPVLPVDGKFVGDYRSKEEIKEQIDKNHQSQ